MICAEENSNILFYETRFDEECVYILAFLYDVNEKYLLIVMRTFIIQNFIVI